jgi:hypothetical protein
MDYMDMQELKRNSNANLNYKLIEIENKKDNTENGLAHMDMRLRPCSK